MPVLSDRRRAIYWLGNLKSTPIHPEISLNILEYGPPLCVLRPAWNSQVFFPVRLCVHTETYVRYLDRLNVDPLLLLAGVGGEIFIRAH